MSNQNENGNMNNVEFGTTEPNTTEISAEEQLAQERYYTTCLIVGQSTMEWANYATRDEYIAHMLELYDSIHPEQENKSKLITPKKEIILPQ